MQQGPWQKYQGQTAPTAPVAPPAAPGGVIYGRPKTPDPLELNRDFRDSQRLDIQIGAENRTQERFERTEQREDRRDQKQATEKQFEVQKSLRTEFDGLPEIKRFNGVRAARQQIRTLASGPGTPQDDIALIISYMRMLDPASVVREGEFATAQNAASVPEAIRNQYNQVVDGSRLNPEQRARILDTAERLYASERETYNSFADRYRQLSEAQGVNPDYVARRYVLDKDNPAFADRYRDNARARPEGEFAWSDSLPEGTEKPELTPQQDAQFQAFLATKPNAQQIDAFLTAIGRPLPQGVTAEERYGPVAESIAKGAMVGGYNYDEAADTRALKEGIDQSTGEAGARDLIMQGATFGLTDEAAGIANAATRALTGDFNLAQSYRVGRDATRLRNDEARGRMGWGGTALEAAGGLLTSGPIIGNALARSAPNALRGRMAQGARVGAGTSALAGFGYGEGAENSLVSAAVAAPIGGALGAAIPVAGQFAKDRIQGVRAFVGSDPQLPRRLVSEAIQGDGRTPAQVGRVMDEAADRGSPLALADTGDNTRALLGSVARQGGRARTMTRAQVIARQTEQQERIASAVVRDLGPTANIRQMSEQLKAQAKTAAAPLYDEAYAQPGAQGVKLDDLMTRPSFKRALERSRRLAAEEGVDPTAMGFDLNEAGEVVLTRTPSWRTLDYVKRGLDDVVETYRDKTTGKLAVDGEGRAIVGTQRALISRMDAKNPQYKAARDAYAGPARLEEALQRGSKALSRNADDLSAEIGRMSDPEKEMYRVGLRKAITDMLESRVDGGDKVQFLIGTPKKRSALRRAFGDRASFDNFIATLGDEAMMNQTYREVATGSQTAERMAADALTGDSALADTMMGTAIRGAKEGTVGMLASIVERVQAAGRFGAGEAGERTRESVAALLTETDRQVLADLLRASQQAARIERRQNRNATIRNARRAPEVGRVVGMGTANALAPRK